MAKAAKPKEEAEKKDVYTRLEEKFGKGMIVRMDDDTVTEPVEVIPTGSFGLDEAIGIGGYPRGRIIEIYGPESSGKTTLGVHMLKEAQAFGEVAIIDAEHAFDFKYAQQIGLSKKGLTFAQPTYGEMSFDIIKELVASGKYSAILLDSVAANIPKEQHEGETGQSRMARLAALNSLEIPKLPPLLSNNKCSLILLNQLRSNIGGYGNPEVPAGGNAIKFFCSVRIDMRKTAEITKSRNKVVVKVIKNKVAPPYETCEFFIDWGIGINRTAEIMNKAIDFNIIKKAGSWFTLTEDTKFQGDEEVIDFLNDNPEFLYALEQQVRQKIKP